MLQVALMLRSAVTELCKHAQDNHSAFASTQLKAGHALLKGIDEDKWQLLRKLCGLLQYFSKATMLMSGSSYSTVGLILPVWRLLNDKVDAYLNTNQVKQ
jgi:hypothetical protein